MVLQNYPEITILIGVVRWVETFTFGFVSIPGDGSGGAHTIIYTRLSAHPLFGNIELGKI